MAPPVRRDPVAVGAGQPAEPTGPVPREVHEYVAAGRSSADLQVLESPLGDEARELGDRGDVKGIHRIASS